MLPNILWITDDQHHADCFSFAGRPQVGTPNLERLVRNGVNFERSYAVGVACVPSRLSMLTGVYVHSHGVYNGMVPVPEQLPALPRVLAEQLGFRTAVIGKKHFGKWAREPFAVDTGEATKGYTRDYLDTVGLRQQFEEEYLAHVADFMAYTSRIPHEHSETEWVATRTIQEIDQTAAEPFFIWCNFSAPHPPYSNSFDSPHLYGPDELDLTQVLHRDPADLHSLSLRPGAVRLGVENVWHLAAAGEASYREALAQYYGLCSAVDAGIGSILAHLETRGDLENTIVIYNSDHGDFAGEYNMLGKCSLGHFECIQRIPTVWYWKGHFGRERITSFIENVDLFPTLCDLLGLEIPSPVQGESYANVLRASSSGPGPAPSTKEKVFYESNAVKSIRTRQFRLSYSGGSGPRNWGELFDLQHDPLERHNRFDDPAYSHVRRELMQELLDWTINTEQPRGIEPGTGDLPDSRWFQNHPQLRNADERNTHRL